MDILSQLGGVGTLSAAGLLGLVVLLIMRGDLVPRRTHEEMRGDRDAWRAAAEVERKRQDAQGEQIDELIDSHRTVVHVIETLQRAAGGAP